MALPAEKTLLIIEELGIPLYSTRGATQSLAPIDAAAQLVRTIDGELDDWSEPQFRKYKSTINCNDVRGFPTDGLWQGRVITVHCIAMLTRAIDALPERDVVGGSEITEGNFVHYCPIITGRVMTFNWVRNEYQDVVGWSLSFEEV